MDAIERAVSLAVEEADERTSEGDETGPGVWHRHFIKALDEAGYTIETKIQP